MADANLHQKRLAGKKEKRGKEFLRVWSLQEVPFAALTATAI
jgi:hypothetical protein